MSDAIIHHAAYCPAPLSGADLVELTKPSAPLIRGPYASADGQVSFVLLRPWTPADGPQVFEVEVQGVGP